MEISKSQEFAMSLSRKNARDFLVKIQKTKKNRDIDAGILDAVLEDRKNVLDLNILVCLDVSGSISRQQFTQFMAQIDAIKGLSRVKVLEVDTKIVAFYDYFKASQSKIARLRGGGGTEFSEAFAKAKQIKPDAILFMTDGYVAGNINDPGIPTGWILTNDGVKPYNWGDVVVKLD